MALTKVTKELIQGSLSVEWQSAIKTSSFQSITGQGYFVNTTASAVTVTMPATASVGDIVSIVDYAGTAQTNNITITAALNINGSSNNVKINYERGSVSIIYSGTAEGWVAEVAANDGTDALVNISPAFSADYLIIAGGGAGSMRNGGGAGAGGLRTSWPGGSGGGGGSETALTITTGTNYTVTVGLGGTQNGATVIGNNGNNSLISGADITSVISIGGGAGGIRSGTAAADSETGRDGGSGGGGGSVSSPNNTSGSGTRVANSDTTNQGFNGGAGADGGAYRGGGGGGAGGSGNTSASGGTGGIGKTISITGGNVDYAGGGGAGANSSAPGSIGYGGGAGSTNNAMNNGVDNTGGGAGSGAGAGTPTGGAGGSGVVILRYLTTSVASFIVTGTLNTPTPIIDGTYSVLKFTTGTGTITFS